MQQSPTIHSPEKLRLGALTLSTCVLLILSYANELSKIHAFIVGDSALFIFILDLCTYHRLFLHIIILGISGHYGQWHKPSDLWSLVYKCVPVMVGRRGLVHPQ